VQHQEVAKEQRRVSSPLNLRRGWRLLNTARWFAAASVRLPAPAAIALVLVLGFLSYNTLFPSSVSRGPESAIPPSGAPSNAQSGIRIIEVPVVQERVVTRTVYVERKARRSQGGLPERADLAAVANRRRSEILNRTAMSLAGFKPTDQVKLTVIKGSYQDEK